MGIKIHEYANEAFQINDEDFYDVDYWNGASYESRKISGATLKSELSGGGGLDVGTTAVTSGTDGRVFFQAAGVLQQDAAFFWDNTNKRLGVGASPASNVRLDVRSQGALSTDIAFRVRNSADTYNTFQVKGNSDISGTNNAGTSSFNIVHHPSSSNYFAISPDSNVWYSATAGAVEVSNTTIALRIGGTANAFYFTGLGSAPYTSWGFKSQGSPARLMLGIGAAESFTFHGTNFGIGNIHPFGTNATQTFGITTGVAPTSSITDGFQQYSADITAGNAAPHFRTEAGNIIKLYQQSSAGITTVADLVTVLQNLGLLS